MEISIRKIGSFFQNDSKGFVINPTSWDNIPSRWLPIVAEVKHIYLTNIGDQLHSIYLRGSLVRGTLIENESDIDSFAIIKNHNFRWKQASWAEEANKKLKKKFEFLTEIEFMLCSLDQDGHLVNPKIAMILKTQSLCIFGDDLSPTISPFKPDKSMMLNYRWLASDLKSFMAKDNRTEADLKEFLKVLIRTGFEVIMQKEGRYTPDLYLCYRTFEKYFPEKGAVMQKALHCYLNPSSWNKKVELEIINLCNWLVQKVKKELF